MGKRTRKLPAPPTPPKADDVRREFVTYLPIGDYDIRQMTRSEPSAGFAVTVRKYRVTVELVDEPVEVIRSRIVDLWERCSNHHRWWALQAEAARYGLDLTPFRFGGKAVRRG